MNIEKLQGEKSLMDEFFAKINGQSVYEYLAGREFFKGISEEMKNYEVRRQVNDQKSFLTGIPRKKGGDTP